MNQEPTNHGVGPIQAPQPPSAKNRIMTLVGLQRFIRHVAPGQ